MKKITLLFIVTTLLSFSLTAQKKFKDTNGKWGLKNAAGKIVVAGKYEYIGDFEKGVATINVGGKLNEIDLPVGGKYGIINNLGVEVIPPIYYSEIVFDEDGTCEISLDGKKMGLINKAGKLLVPIEYDERPQFHATYAKVRKDNKYGIIKLDGSFLLPIEYASIDVNEQEKFFIVGKETSKKGVNKYGILNTSGQEVLPMEYDNIGYLNDGFAIIVKNDKYGFINKLGKIAIPLEYDEVKNFYDGLAMVYKNKKAGFIDKTGKVVTPLEYEYVNNFNDGMAAVYKDKKWGYVNKTGALVIPLKYDQANDFFNGVAYVKIGLEAMDINKKGVVVKKYTLTDF